MCCLYHEIEYDMEMEITYIEIVKIERKMHNIDAGCNICHLYIYVVRCLLIRDEMTSIGSSCSLL